jgi:hypothetical protein
MPRSSLNERSLKAELNKVYLWGTQTMATVCGILKKREIFVARDVVFK